MRYDRRRGNGIVWLAAVLSVLLHIPVVYLYVVMLQSHQPFRWDDNPIMVEYYPFEEPEELLEEEVEEPEKDPDGQVVELPAPKDPQKPEDARFLAEYDITVPEETRSERFKIAPEVVAPTYSDETAFELEDVLEMNVEDPCTGATAGGVVFERKPYGSYVDIASKYDFINKTGTSRPARASHRLQRLQGAPSNDYLPDIDPALATQLNADEFLFAGFLNRVKRMVSFYANQTLANARPRVPVTKMAYDLTINAMLDAEGNLVAVEVVEESGIPAFDEAIAEAWRLAAPFPNPPPGMVSEEGFIHIDDFGFHIAIGRARAELTGIDPRQDVMFPGLQTIPGR